MSSQATRSNNANRETPHGGMNGPSGGDSRFETGREFAASKEDYNFDNDENNASEDDSDDGPTRASAEEELRCLMRYSDVPDYYSLLGLPRDPPPTNSQIRSAFQRLSLSFHPDKQPLHLRHIARDQYSKIQRAYDTLVDPQKRVVYDLIGEEGVNAEWGAGGAMSKGGEAQESQIGVRTMTSAEFRQWFLGLMQRRERSTLEEMIGSRGSVNLTLDAVPFFQWINLVPVLEDRMPHSSRIAGLHLSHSFKVPVPWLKSTHSIGLSSSTPSYQRFRTDESQFPHSSASTNPALVVNAAVFGTLQRPKQNSIFKLNGTDEEVTREVTLPPVLISRQFSLDSRMTYTVPEVPQNMTGFKMRSWRLMQGCGLELGGTLLPDPTFYTATERQFTPLSGTQPIFARAQATFHHPIHEMPPVANVMLSRRLAPDQEVYCSWTSKQNFWADFPIRGIVDVLHLGAKDGLYQLIPGNFEIGYKTRPQELHDDKGNSRTKEDQDGDGRSQKASSRPTWGFSLESSGHAAGLSITYSRDIFGQPRNLPALSSWSAEDYYAQDEEFRQEPNPMRLTIETSIGLDGSLGGSIGGSRKIGNFARMGLFVGSVGGVLVLKLQWNRLGQDVEIPIIVCPPELINPDVVKAALMVPWATFLLVEFGILRPRARRKWQKAIEDRRTQLTKLVARRRAESAQAIELMTSQVKRRQNDEKSKDGLFIIHAEYGVRKAARRKASAEVDNSTDVTIPVAALVHNGQLSLPRRVKKSQILGFHDPAPLSRKTLSLRYRFGGAEHFVEVNENENLLCPMKEHRLSSINELD